MLPWRLHERLRPVRVVAAVFRDFTESCIHHRGQFLVYLRLLDVPVPVPTGRRKTSPVVVV